MKRTFCAACILLLGWHALAGEMEDARKHAAEAVKTAKTGADLDASLDELTAVINQYAPKLQAGSPEELTINNLEEARSFVRKWQNYLVAKAGGYDAEARSIAKELADQPMLLLPRSVILAKAYEPLKSPQTTVVNVAIDREGKVTIGDAAPVPLADVYEPIAALKASASQAAVVIHADKSQPYEKIREVIQAFGKAGFSNLTLAKDHALHPESSPAQPK